MNRNQRVIPSECAGFGDHRQAVQQPTNYHTLHDTGNNFSQDPDTVSLNGCQNRISGIATGQKKVCRLGGRNDFSDEKPKSVDDRLCSRQKICRPVSSAKESFRKGSSPSATGSNCLSR